MKVWTFLATVLLTGTTAFGAGPSDVLGSWTTEGGDSRLEFSGVERRSAGRSHNPCETAGYGPSRQASASLSLLVLKLFT